VAKAAPSQAGAVAAAVSAAAPTASGDVISQVAAATNTSTDTVQAQATANASFGQQAAQTGASIAANVIAIVSTISVNPVLPQTGPNNPSNQVVNQVDPSIVSAAAPL
jgi:hypothetical protein